MSHGIVKDAFFFVPAIPIIERKVFTIPYMHSLDLGKEFPWILWVGYKPPRRDMTIYLL